MLPITITMETSCRVDLVIKPPTNAASTPSKRSGGGGFMKLRLDFPLNVQHDLARYEEQQDPDEEGQDFDPLIANDGHGGGLRGSSAAHIAKETKILALNLADRCQLRQS